MDLPRKIAVVGAGWVALAGAFAAGVAFSRRKTIDYAETDEAEGIAPWMPGDPDRRAGGDRRKAN